MAARKTTPRNDRTRRTAPGGPTVPSASVPDGNRQSWWLLVLIAAAIALTYANSLPNPFVLDDFDGIVTNETFRDWRDVRRVVAMPRELPVSGRPVVNATFAINYALGGLDAAGFRAANVAIHIGAALLLFGVMRRTLARPSIPAGLHTHAQAIAFAVALLWGVHPLNSEVMNYVVQRTESLMGFFLLLTLYASIRALDGPRPLSWSAIAITACALGMGCKETMVVAPVLLVLYDGLLVFDSPWRALRARRSLYAGLAASWLLLAALNWYGPRAHSTGLDTGVNSWTYLLNQAPIVLRYLGLSFWPRALVINYGWPVQLTLGDVLPQALAVVAVLVLTVVALWQRRPAAMLGAWFFVTLAPASSFVPIATEVAAERRMYVPLIAVIGALVIGVVVCWQALARRWTSGVSSRVSMGAAVTACVLIAGVFMAMTFVRNREYRSTLALVQLNVDRYPTPVGLHVLATELIRAGRRDEAVQRLREAVPGAPRAYYTLGVELFAAARFDESRDAFEEFIRLQPHLLEAVDAHLALGRIAEKQQRWADAQKAYETARAMAPRRVEILSLLGRTLNSQERFDDAIPLLQRAISLQPQDIETWTDLGVAFIGANRLDDAIVAFRRAVDLAPARGDVLRNLAMALVDKGQFDDAAVYAERALADRPADPDLRSLIDQIRAARAARSNQSFQR